MKEDSLINIHSLLLDVTKVAAALSIFCSVFGFLYLLIYITILLGDSVFFPVSIQDIFMFSRRWGLLAICIVIIILNNENGFLQKFKIELEYNKKYIFIKYIMMICQKIYYVNTFLLCCLLIAMYNHIFEYKIILYFVYIILVSMFIAIISIKYISKIHMVMLLFSIVVSSVYYDISKIYLETSIYMIKEKQNIYYGKIYLHLADGIFLQTKDNIIYLKSNIIQSVSKLN